MKSADLLGRQMELRNRRQITCAGPVAAYVLIEALRRLGFRGTEFARVQAGTIRQPLLKIGVRVRATTRRIVLYFASGYPWKVLFEAVVARLHRAPSAPSTP